MSAKARPEVLKEIDEAFQHLLHNNATAAYADRDAIVNNLPREYRLMYIAVCLGHELTENRKFRIHLDDASEVVSTWPEWKRNVLGKAKE